MNWCRVLSHWRRGKDFCPNIIKQTHYRLFSNEAPISQALVIEGSAVQGSAHVNDKRWCTEMHLGRKLGVKFSWAMYVQTKGYCSASQATSSPIGWPEFEALRVKRKDTYWPKEYTEILNSWQGRYPVSLLLGLRCRSCEQSAGDVCHYQRQ